MGIIGKDDFVVADVFDGGFGLALVARDEVAFDQREDEIAIEVAEEPRAIARLNGSGMVYTTFLVFA